MTLGEKLKDAIIRFGLTQESLASLLNVSRQAITKWERNEEIPDISNLQELSSFFNLSIDYLLDNKSVLPNLNVKIKLDKTKYKSKLSMYESVLNEYFDSSFDIYILTRHKKMNIIETLIDTFTVPELGPIETADALNDLSPYYLVKKGNIRLLVSIKNYTLTITELNINKDKKIVYNNNIFIRSGKLRRK